MNDMTVRMRVGLSRSKQLPVPQINHAIFVVAHA